MMMLREICRLSWKELLAHRVRSVGTAVVMGAMFGLVLVILTVTQGVEDVVLKYAQNGTEGKVYLASCYDDNGVELILGRVSKYGGKNISLTSEELGGGVEISEGGIIAEFNNVKNAFDYYEKNDAAVLGYKKDNYQIVELFSNQMAVYKYFRQVDRNVIGPVVSVLLVAAGVVFILTASHALSQNAKMFALYRTLGASRKQILVISLMYLVGLCGLVISVVLLVIIVAAGVITLLGWGYLRGKITEIYPGAVVDMSILMGWNLRCLGVIVSMIACAPLTLMLSLDQFTTRRLAWQLKGD